MAPKKRRPRLLRLRTLRSGGALGGSDVRYIISATQSGVSGDISLSASHASIGDQLTITGTGFGSSQGDSYVTFGEAEVTTAGDGGVDVNWAPCTKEAASYVSWADTSITVTVPSMSPGAPGYPGTYHNVRVYVDGVESDGADFYIDPVATNPSSTSYIAWSTSGDGNQTVTRTANENTTGGVQGYDYEAPDNAWLGCHVVGSNVLFQNCTFTCTNEGILGDYGGIVTVGQGPTSVNVTFVNCTFMENWGEGDPEAFWIGVNGLKVVTRATDVTVSDCVFEPFSRMTYEAITWGGIATTNLALVNCTFDPPGNQVVSFGSADDIYSLVDNCTFRGAGNHATYYPDGAAAWEANGARYIVTRDCTFMSSTWGHFNINGYPPESTRPAYLYFENCATYSDAAHLYSTQRSYLNSNSTEMEWAHVNRVRLTGCTFNTGDASRHLNSLGPCNWGGGAVCWAANSNYNDFTGSTVSGYVDWDGDQMPSTAAAYFRGSDGDPVLSGNILPTVV